MEKYFINFSKYSIIGILVSILSISLSWFLIDLMGFKAIVASTIIGIAGFSIKYLGYTKIKLIKKN